MWAPTRQTAPASPTAGGGEPAAEKHALIDLQAVGVQGGAGVVAQRCPGAVEDAADVGAAQADRAITAAASGGEPAGAATCSRRPAGSTAARAGPESLRSSAPVQSS